MTYSIRIKRSASKALSKLPTTDRQRLADAIERLKDEPFAGSALKGDHSGLRRIRVGRYRVIYAADQQELVVLVLRIGHRREIYR